MRDVHMITWELSIIELQVRESNSCGRRSLAWNANAKVPPETKRRGMCVWLEIVAGSH